MTEVRHGFDALESWSVDRPDGVVVLVTGRALVGTAGPVGARQALRRAGRDVRRVLLQDDADPAGVAGLSLLAEQLRDVAAVVAVGGGAVLDQVKLALAIAAEPRVRDRLALRQRSGLVALPDAPPRRVPLAALPTTLGTGSEVSAAACLTDVGRKRLVLGPALQPDVAVLAPEATASLPPELVSEGVLEALFRAVGPYVGDDRELPTEDALTELTAVRLVHLGDQVSAARRAGRPVPGTVRHEIAILSGLTHGSLLHRGRDPFAVRGWAVANELSVLAGIRKMTAVAAILPAVWQAVADGVTGWGSARRLHRIWTRIAAADPLLSAAHPGSGLRALVDRWQVTPHVDPSGRQAAECAARVMHGWGGGLPMLGRLRTQDVADVLRRALTPVSEPVPVPA